MLHHDALFESCVVVLATVTAVHGDLHRVELILRVFLRRELVRWDANVVVPKRHVRS